MTFASPPTPAPIFIGPNDGNGNDVIHGDAGDDTIFGGSGEDWMFGEQGNDAMFGMGGRDVMLGDAGTFAWTPDGAGGLHLDVFLADVGAVTQTVDLGGTPLTDPANPYAAAVLGSDIVIVDEESGTARLVNRIEGGNDTLEGGADGDFLFGQGGNDTLVGDSGADYMEGNAGDDTLLGGDEDDILVGDFGANLAPDSPEIPHVLHGLALADGDVLNPFEVDIPFTDRYEAVLPHVMFHHDAFVGMTAHAVPDFTAFAAGLHDDFDSHLHHLLNNFYREGGNDTIEGGRGDDVLIGDFGTNLSPGRGVAVPGAGSPVTITPFVPGDPVLGKAAVLSADVADANGWKGVSDGIRADLANIAAFLNGRDADHHDRVDAQNLDEAGLLTAFFGNGDPDNVNHELVGGNDTLRGGDGEDVMVGDHTTVTAAFTNGQSSEDHEGGHHHFVQALDLIGGDDVMEGNGGDDIMLGDSSTVVAAFASLSATETNEHYRNKKDHSHFHSSDQNGHFSAVHDLRIIGGNDIMDGGAGNDGIVGDNSAVIVPVVEMTSDVTYRNVSQLPAFDPGLSGEALDLIAGFIIVGGDDVIRGGGEVLDGPADSDNDTVLGDNSLIVAPIVTVSQSVEIGDYDDKGSKKHTTFFVKHDDLLDDIVDGIEVLGGNDEIYGGAGNDALLGDSSAIVAPVVTLTQDVRYLDGDGHHKHKHHHGHDDQPRFDEHDVVRNLRLVGGNDTIDAGEGDDVLGGDNAAVIAPSLILGQNVVYEGDHRHNQHHRFQGNGHQILGDVVDEVILTGGGDTLYGSGGNDLLTGDNFTVVAPVVDITLNRSHDQEQKKHHKHHHDEGGNGPMDDVVGDVTTAGGDDTLNGGGGSDLITGDNTTVIAPTVGITLNTNHHGHRHRHGHDDGHHHTQGGHDVLSSLTSFVGDDVIYGGDGADFITGDDAIRLAPQMDITVNNTSASHHKHDQDLDRYDLFLDDVVGRIEIASAYEPAEETNGRHGHHDDDDDDDHKKDDRRGGNDEIHGGAGNDLMTGDNVIVFDPSTSVAINSGSDHHHHHGGKHHHRNGLVDSLVDDLVMLGGDDIMNGGDGDDLMMGDNISIELLAAGTNGHHDDDDDDDHKHHKHNGHIHSAGNTHTTGGGDTMSGGGGDDVMFGQAGRDFLFGEDGEDTLYGGKDKDKVDGGAGKDKVKGGKASHKDIANVLESRFASILSENPWAKGFLLDLLEADGSFDPNKKIHVVLHSGGHDDD